MLQNIFLFKGKNFQELSNLNIYNYPEDFITINHKDLISKIIYGHDQADLIKQYRTGKTKLERTNNVRNNEEKQWIIDTPVPQVINDLNIYTSCINGKNIIGLIFDKDDNPFDYKEVFETLLNEILNVERSYLLEDEIEIETFLISLFIDIRRYGDEFIDKPPVIELFYQEGIMKVFLFGIDEAGKSSLVRRLKTGQFNDNFLAPTRKFTIEYIQKEDVLIAVWDMPGQRAFREKWMSGIQDSNTIIFMFDVANQLRFEESKIEFWKILNRYELSGVPLLILGNKYDLINRSGKINREEKARLKNELFNFFEFDNIDGREWIFLFTSVKTNYNIREVLNKLLEFTRIS